MPGRGCFRSEFSRPPVITAGSAVNGNPFGVSAISGHCTRRCLPAHILNLVCEYKGKTQTSLARSNVLSAELPARAGPGRKVTLWGSRS